MPEQFKTLQELKESYKDEPMPIRKDAIRHWLQTHRPLPEMEIWTPEGDPEGFALPGSPLPAFTF